MVDDHCCRWWRSRHLGAWTVPRGGITTELMEYCPAVCGWCYLTTPVLSSFPSPSPGSAPTPFVCQDHSLYPDAYGLSCPGHRSRKFRCFGPMLLMAGYGKEEVNVLHAACPKSYEHCARSTVGPSGRPSRPSAGPSTVPSIGPGAAPSPRLSRRPSARPSDHLSPRPSDRLLRLRALPRRLQP